MESASPVLWVCWKKPTFSDKVNGPVVSFMPPKAESECERDSTCTIIRSREIVQSIKSEARELYCTLVARIGTAPVDNKGTFRKLLTKRGKKSLWWYHPVSMKQCENDPAYNRIIILLTIQSVARRYGAMKLVIVGGPRDVVTVLKKAFIVKDIGTERSYGIWWPLCLGLALRINYCLRSFREFIAIQRWFRLPSGFLDIVFFGYWDWSVLWNNKRESIEDRYFKDLPSELARRGSSSIGWFAWFSPLYEKAKGKRHFKDILVPLHACKNIVLLQALLSPLDIIKSVLDVRPLRIFLKVRKQKQFQETFNARGLNVYPLFSTPLLLGFINDSIPHCTLVSLATARACTRYRPRAMLNFQEHFAQARAHYAGVQSIRRRIPLFAVQHASYNHDKTFLFFDPEREFKGIPDGCAVPHPDYICAMGSFSKGLFLECGYSQDHIVITGSPRYDHVRQWLDNESQEEECSKGIRVLMVCNLGVELDLQMVEAVCDATEGMQDLHLLLRNHPFFRIEKRREFDVYKHLITVTQRTLEEDIAGADLIIFIYSTVAEEAFIRGKPVWQWLPLGFNGSALAEIGDIPQFSSVGDLRKALQAFQTDRSHFIPSVGKRTFLFNELFYQSDDQRSAAARIADAIIERL
ncbi:MAG: hypothetical protein ACMUIP_02565 [bacterium]